MVFRAFCVGTLVREFQRKKCFSLEFHSLNRTSDLTVQGTHVRESKKKKVFFFCTSLTYSYLCVRNLLITWKNISYRQENTALPHSIP